MLCVMISPSVMKYAVNKEEIIFLSISRAIVITCFIELIVLSETQFYEVPLVAR